LIHLIRSHVAKPSQRERSATKTTLSPYGVVKVSVVIRKFNYLVNVRFAYTRLLARSVQREE